MKIEFVFSENFPWGLLFFWLLIWLAVLGRVLTRTDFDTPTKLLWVFVVVMVPFFGVFLYTFLAPAAPVSAAAAASKSGPHLPRSDVAGTPWANNPHFTND